MKKFILTIGREFGSCGGKIGKMIAEAYQVPYYDKKRLDEIIMDKYHIYPNDIERIDELFKSGLPIKLWSNPDKDLLKRIYQYQKDYIEVTAKETGGVFVGRCADFILQDYPNHISAFIYSPIGVRTNYLINRYGLNLEATQTLIARMDQSRHNFYKYFTKENRGDRHNRHIYIDSSLLGTEGTVEVLKLIIDKKFSS